MSHLVRAAALKGFRDVMRDLGAEPIPLLRQFGIDPADMDNTDAMLPITAVCELLETSSEIAKAPDLGLRISRMQDVGVFGVLGLAIQNARSPSEGAEIVSRFIFIQGTALHLEVVNPSPMDDDAVALSLEISGVPKARQRQIIELLLGTSHQIGRLRQPLGNQLKAVSLPHAPSVAQSVYRSYFGVPVWTNQPVAAMHLKASGWNSPMPDGNADLRRIVEDYLSRHFPPPAQHLSDRVRVVLKPLLNTPRANREEIARILAIHPRTMHRQLRAEETTFQDIKDGMRRDLAQKYLVETDMSLDRIASLLGFPEQSALTRACRKWFGKPPSVLRKLAASGGND